MAVGALGRPPEAPPGPPGSARWLPGTALVCFLSYRPKFGHVPFLLTGLRAHVRGTVAREREGVRNTSGFTGMSPPGAPGGGGEARGVPHLGPAPLE